MKLNRELHPALASAMLAAALFAVCVGGTYVFDDINIIHFDPRIKDPALWGQFWTHNYHNGVDRLYRPLVSMSYAIQWQLHGDRPWAFHLVNILLHAAVSASVAELARRLIGWRAGMIAGLLFASHPIHVEAVAGIIGRAELMCALGIFGAMILMLRPITTGRAVAIAGCFVLALLSKEQGMLLPLILLIQGICCIQRDSAHRKSLLLLALLICWPAATYIVWREMNFRFWWNRELLDWTLNPLVLSSGRDRMLMPLVLLGHYTALLIAPVRLSIDYGSTVIGWQAKLSDPNLYLGVFAVLVWIVVFTIALIRRWMAIVLAALGLAVTYGVVGNIVTLIGTSFGERLMYIPSGFFLIIVAAALARLPRSALIGVMSLMLILASARSFTYALRWNEAIRFHEIAVREQPESIRLRMLLAEEYQRQGRYDDATRVLVEARQMLPDYPRIWITSGILELHKKDFDQACAYFARAIELDPKEALDGWIELTERRRAAATQSSP